MMWTCFAAGAYFYMVTSWGGYIFVTNTVSVYVVVLLILGSFSPRHYVVYCVWYVLGTVACLNIPFVGFQAVTSSEHMASHGVFLLVNTIAAVSWLQDHLSARLVNKLTTLAACTVTIGFLAMFGWLTFTGKTRWAGRSMSLLDPTSASQYVPIIASVSEHQPPTWSNYITDMHFLVFLTPVGLYYCFSHLSDGSVFLGVYGMLSVYFSGVMTRLLLVLAPSMCCLSGIATSLLINTFLPAMRNPSILEYESGRRIRRLLPYSRVVGILIIFFLSWGISKYVMHCTYMSSFAYSQPSIVLSDKLRDGSRVIQDDFREAYYWLRMNTHKKATVASWWDYGYQITVMGNRTVLVDNNTWNNTHIGTIGLILCSSEEDAYPIIRRLDIDYILVVFGGVARFAGDDINKFLWPIRISSGVYPDKVQESDFIGKNGFTIDETASERMKNSLMYKLSYYRAAEITQGHDFARRQKIGQPFIELKHLEEAFTTKNWIVRIYKVKAEANRGVAMQRRVKSSSSGFKSRA
eukprot:gnl/MRDRNA2_/MRDRNA2_32600_c0_seq1.p1 gnl/MRDRNA2_/MRDRNA2_32600_c0~~gnl/MRDRNA2_/MRDRNA2_32600_c0_seq1.p1  ORF type:complete len:521 (-),score=46.37 gnl/MRDRNA2_/MRDRNA2_32600_c0_seq1:11-1573(-)